MKIRIELLFEQIFCVQQLPGGLPFLLLLRRPLSQLSFTKVSRYKVKMSEEYCILSVTVAAKYLAYVVIKFCIWIKWNCCRFYDTASLQTAYYSFYQTSFVDKKTSISNIWLKFNNYLSEFKEIDFILEEKSLDIFYYWKCIVTVCFCFSSQLLVLETLTSRPNQKFCLINLETFLTKVTFNKSWNIWVCAFLKLSLKKRINSTLTSAKY